MRYIIPVWHRNSDSSLSLFNFFLPGNDDDFSVSTFYSVIILSIIQLFFFFKFTYVIMIFENKLNFFGVICSTWSPVRIVVGCLFTNVVTFKMTFRQPVWPLSGGGVKKKKVVSVSLRTINYVLGVVVGVWRLNQPTHSLVVLSFWNEQRTV